MLIVIDDNFAGFVIDFWKINELNPNIKSLYTCYTFFYTVILQINYHLRRPPSKITLNEYRTSYLCISFLWMTHLIKIKNSTFSVSKSFVRAITINNFNFRVIEHKGEEILLLDTSCLSSFLIVLTRSSTHFFIKIHNSNKLRVNKKFFDFLVLHSKPTTHAAEKTHCLRTIFSPVIDQFYTKPATAQSCVYDFVSSVSLEEKDLIIEPSAGNGSFMEPLNSIKCEKVFLDIAPKNTKTKKVDFLSWEPPKTLGKIHVIGNPPFGRQSSLCRKFINHASKFADSISFILPATYNKVSMFNKMPLNFQLTLSKDLGPKPCLNTNANCVFQIWQKVIKIRKIINLVRKHPDFEFLKPGDTSACFCVRNTGSMSSLGKICSIPVANRAPRSFHWIKSNIDTKLLLNRFYDMKLPTQISNVRISHIAQYELIHLYTKHCN